MILVCALICRGQRRQIVVPVAIRNGAILHAARSRQHLEADEGRFGGEHFVLIAQERADDVGHDAFRPAAGDDVFHLEIELRGQHFAQVAARRRGRDSGSPSVLLMASMALGDAPSGFSLEASLAMRVEPVLPAHGFDGAPGFVGPQRFDVGRNQRH